jgi:HTH-type transcriptional regulator/antitoxin HigA
MNIKPIKTEADHQAALAEIEGLFEAKPGTPEGDKLEILTTLVEAYEEEYDVIPQPDPVEAILYYMESRGLTRKDLEPYIGTRARVAEIINRTRPLSLGMIQRLHLGLGIPAEALIQPYQVAAGMSRKAAGKGKNATHATIRAGAD